MASFRFWGRRWFVVYEQELVRGAEGGVGKDMTDSTYSHAGRIPISITHTRRGQRGWGCRGHVRSGQIGGTRCVTGARNGSSVRRRREAFAVIRQIGTTSPRACDERMVVEMSYIGGMQRYAEVRRSATDPIERVIVLENEILLTVQTFVLSRSDEECRRARSGPGQRSPSRTRRQPRGRLGRQFEGIQVGARNAPSRQTRIGFVTGVHRDDGDQTPFVACGWTPRQWSDSVNELQSRWVILLDWYGMAGMRYRSRCRHAGDRARVRLAGAPRWGGMGWMCAWHTSCEPRKYSRLAATRALGGMR